MRTSLIALVLSVLVLAGCGKKDADKKPDGPVAPPGGSGASDTLTTPRRPPDAAASWTGTLEKMGPSIVMQGTHKLVEGGKTVAILQSKKADLASYEGTRVTVTGTSAPTVEGHQTIVDVETIKKAD